MAVLLEDDVRGLDRLPPDALYEVVDGEAKEVSHMGAAANILAVELALLLGRVRTAPRDVIALETLFALPAPVNRRRRPDVAYVPAARVRASWPPPPGEDPPAMDAVPTLVVEVISPTDLMVELEEKRLEYFAAGVTTVVFAFPTFRTIHVHDSAARARVLTEADTLDVGAALPGFAVPIAELFAPLNPPTQP